MRRNASTGTRVDQARAEEESRRRGVAVDEPLRLVHEVGGDVDRAAALDARVEEPPGAAERGAVDELLEMVDALLLDGARGAVGAKPPKSGRSSTSRLTSRPSCRAGPSSSRARAGRRRGSPASSREVGRLHQPRLVGQHVEAGGVQPAHHAGLAAVLAGEHHHVAPPLDEEPCEGVGGAPAPGAASGGRSARRLKRSTSARKSSSSAPARRVDEDLVGATRGVRHAQGQRRRGSGPGSRKSQGVHGRAAMVPHLLLCGRGPRTLTLRPGDGGRVPWHIGS